MSFLPNFPSLANRLTPHQIDLIVEFGIRFALTLSVESHVKFINEVLPQIRIPFVEGIDLQAKQDFEQICRRIGEGLVSASEKASTQMTSAGSVPKSGCEVFPLAHDLDNLDNSPHSPHSPHTKNHS